MRITDIKVFPVREEKLKAFISIVLDECFMVNDIKVIRGKEGFFISMPSRRKRNGKFKDIAHPLNNETRQVMEREILAAYEKALAPDSKERDESTARPTHANEVAPAIAAVGVPEARTSGVESGRPDGGSGTQTDLGDSERAAAPAVRESGREDRREAPTGITGGPSAEPAPEPAGETEEADKSAEEVAELHLRDSFWET